MNKKCILKNISHFQVTICCQEIPAGLIFKIHSEIIAFHYLYCYKSDLIPFSSLAHYSKGFSTNFSASTPAPLPQSVHRTVRLFLLKHKSDSPFL